VLAKGSTIANPTVQESLMKSVGFVTSILKIILKVDQSVDVKISAVSVISMVRTPSLSDVHVGVTLVIVGLGVTVVSAEVAPNCVFVQVDPQVQLPQA